MVSSKLIAPLSDELAKEYGMKRIGIRKDDTVRVMRGDNYGFEGKVTQVFPESGRIAIEGLTRKKADGTPVYIKIHASKVEITKLNTNDPRRKDIINRKASRQKEEQGGKAQ
ncbi:MULTISPECIES: 50S ribosomal protein L24 [Metallosphaera]|uniref:Large ribosomal subunit protein uL24 n=3 Tax=Metallosphaera TaxID=41980 RepID=RL24_METS5|nr:MULTISPECIES: 50S ribosomal protein L24 [Metallosphaera]A4YCX7.1 RecName: Full=Large ribosomal subunit protein uL24; AltName: Full=50S ribosomal protein L24 [Metallosphaera sedula DSM 5348]ABP94279.1 LSU ribosomal protein L24P [Metallosphaera sedula DSM 5348]AIM26266.1 LSU ribosomal protein L24P [Metallosphaera sedula]AKV73281.1 50S ribosomal protein L24 [Metallosphaera sedula]AKV75525.1 50S ribosomal protein L24 [Metallosphaera sedula]AKV77771.1 50S ribosomal protein L24 [Metallosphaera s